MFTIARFATRFSSVPLAAMVRPPVDDRCPRTAPTETTRREFVVLVVAQYDEASVTRSALNAPGQWTQALFRYAARQHMAPILRN
ncbi:hypothetical protein [Burkholderia humptydooensis]|uniref:hypothetical protein n=1 Tax=Burkholderia humptydooensis TaxID=430531 RepID=UPI0010FDEED7|nr:hypothetical protein [Burkholderia humptydooensis]